MNFVFKLLVIYRTLLTGLILLEMNSNNLIRIRCIPLHKEVQTPLENTAENEPKQVYEQHVAPE